MRVHVLLHFTNNACKVIGVFHDANLSQRVIMILRSEMILRNVLFPHESDPHERYEMVERDLI